MFPIEVIDIQNSLKIDTMGIWNILFSVMLNPSNYFGSLSNDIGYD